MSEPVPSNQAGREYPTNELVRRLLALAWQFRSDCLLSLGLSLTLLLLGLAGLQLLGVVIDVIRRALVDGPQLIHHDTGDVVVLPLQEFERLAGTTGASLGEFLRLSLVVLGEKPALIAPARPAAAKTAAFPVEPRKRKP